MLKKSIIVGKLKEQIYASLIERDMTSDELAARLNIDKSKIANYTKRMRLQGYIKTEKLYDTAINRFLSLHMAVKSKPYVLIVPPTREEVMASRKKSKEEQKLEKEIARQSEANRVTRYNLLDNPLPRAPRTRKSEHTGIGSFFAMFDTF